MYYITLTERALIPSEGNLEKAQKQDKIGVHEKYKKLKKKKMFYLFVCITLFLLMKISATNVGKANRMNQYPEEIDAGDVVDKS